MEDETKPKPSRKRKRSKTPDAPIAPVEDVLTTVNIPRDTSVLRGFGEGVVEDLVEEVEPESAEPEPPAPAAAPRTRISGDELRHLLREQRRKARLEEKGY